jgi:MOSC domain-containing protein YiiM
MPRVASINVSNGGVPKQPVETARLTTGGLEGDRQRDTRYHGGPDRAVTLFSLERIQALQREGHSIAPGSIGENLTLEGLDWGALQAADRLRIGEAQVELTKPASPCPTISGSFQGGDFSRVSHKRHPGWSRFCARVLDEGVVRVGDPVTHIRKSL